MCPPASPTDQASLAAQLQATEVFTAELTSIDQGLLLRLPDWVAEAGYHHPPQTPDEVGFWSAIEDRLREQPAAGGLLQLLVAHGEQVIAVRLRHQDERRWAMCWAALSDCWVDDRGRHLLPRVTSDRTTSVVLDTDGLVLCAQERYHEVVDGPAGPVEGLRWDHTVPADSAGPARLILDELAAGEQVDRIVPTAQGRLRWLRVQASHGRQGGTGRAVLLVRIEELAGGGADPHSLVAQLVRDPLTGLYNRRAFFDLAGLDAAATSRFVGVLLVDIRRFKRINDLWGQQVGDRCLVEAADWLRSMAAAEDVVLRLSGAQFVVLVTGQSVMAASLRRGGERTVYVSGHRILLSLQAGWAPRGPSTTLLTAAEEADKALAVAKREAWRTVVHWTAEISQDAVEAALVEEAVQHALAARQEAVLFQPVVNMAERRVSGVEALVRLGGPAAGLPTDRILAASHKLGLTPQFAERVYDLAFTEGLQLRAVFPDCLLGVNVSREFLSTGLAIDTVLGSAQRAGVAPEEVVVELTEDVAAGLSGEQLIGELRRAAELGLQVVIDDFGRGETSLSVLRTLPLSGIKLDRSLLPLDDEDRAWDFVEGTVSLLSNLTGRIIAEGIETELQSRRLRAIGIHLQQGYFFGQPETSRHWLQDGLVLPAD
ncbi:MAG: EAL domain-containing protein [Jatrophihabitans sp.]